MRRPFWCLRRSIRAGLGLTFIVLVASVTSAMQRAPISSRVYGSLAVWPGHTALFRVLCLRADGVTGCRTPQIQARWASRQADGAWQGHGAAVEADLYGAVRLAVPDPWPAHSGVWIHVADAGRRSADDVFITLHPRPPPSMIAGEMRPPVRLVASPSGAMQAELWPQDGAVVAGLPAFGVGRLRSGGQPHSAALAQAPSSPLSIDGPVDKAGHFGWHVAPRLADDLWQLQLPRARLLLWAHVHSEPRQLSLSLSQGPFIAAGRALQYRLRTMPLLAPVHIDVWLGQALIAGADVVAGAHSLALPPDACGPLLVTAYRQSFTPDDTHVSQVAWVHPGPGAGAADVEALGRWLGVPPGPQALWDLTARQGMFVPKVFGAPLLAATHERRQADFVRTQRQRRRLGQCALAAILSAGGLGAVAYVRRGQRLRRAAVRRAIGPEADVYGAAVQASAQAITGLDLNAWLWAALGILACLGLGLIELLGHLVMAP